MSNVTNVILLPGEQWPEVKGPWPSWDFLAEQDCLQKAILTSHEAPEEDERGRRLGPSLRDIAEGEAADEWGGSKRPETEVYAAAFNHLDYDVFKAWVEGLPWLAPNQVRLLVHGQDDDSWAVLVLRGGKLVELLGA